MPFFLKKKETIFNFKGTLHENTQALLEHLQTKSDQFTSELQDRVMVVRKKVLSTGVK